jgi:hypothetical protein
VRHISILWESSKIHLLFHMIWATLTFLQLHVIQSSLV